MLSISESLSKKNTTSVRGVLVWGVLLSHLGLPYPISNIGYLCVAGFLFFSGYGLGVNFRTNPFYLNTFIKKRISSIVVPYWTACVFYILFVALLGFIIPLKSMIIGFINPFIDTYRYISVAWYVCAIILFYTLFYVSYKLFRERQAFCIVLYCIVLYCIVLEYFKIKPIYWMVSNLAFICGLYFSSLDMNRIEKSINRHYVLLLNTLLILFLLSLTIALPFHFNLYISSLLFVLLLALLLKYNIFMNNMLLVFYGTIAYEFFLIHPLIIQFVNNNGIFLGPTKDRVCCYWPYIYSMDIENKILQVIIVGCISTIIAYLLHILNSFFIKQVSFRIQQ